MMDWQTFGVIAAVGYLVVLLAGLTRFTGLRNLRNPVNPVNPVPKNAWMVFLVFAVIATVEAQKPTNNVPQNLNAPLAPMGEVHPLQGLARLIWPEAFAPRILSQPLQMADAEKMAANWNRRGAWRDWQGLAAKPNGAPQC